MPSPHSLLQIRIPHDRIDAGYRNAEYRAQHTVD